MLSHFVYEDLRGYPGSGSEWGNRTGGDLNDKQVRLRFPS